MKKLLICFLVLFTVLNQNLFAASTATCNDTDTVLMLHMDGSNGSTTFTDSATAKTVTPAGDAQISTAQSKFGGASGLFDGTGDKLTLADSNDWDLGTGDFTIDGWIRGIDDSSRRAGFISVGDGWNNTGIYIRWNTVSLIVYIRGSSTLTYSFAPVNTTWYHIAVTRSGTSLKLFVNGTQQASATNSSDIQGATDGTSLAITPDTAQPLNGNLDEMRVVKGTAIWTSNFTPPTAAYADTCVSRRRILYTSVDA